MGDPVKYSGPTADARRRRGLAAALSTFSASLGRSPDALRPALRDALVEASTYVDERPAELLGADAEKVYFGDRRRLDDALSAGDLKRWFGLDVAPGPVRIVAGERWVGVPLERDLPPTAGFTADQLHTARRIGLEAVAEATLPGCTFEVIEGASYCIVQVAGLLKGRGGLRIGQIVEATGAGVDAEPGDELLFDLALAPWPTLFFEALAEEPEGPLVRHAEQNIGLTQLIEAHLAFRQRPTPAVDLGFTADVGLDPVQWRTLGSTGAVAMGLPARTAHVAWHALSERSAQTGWQPLLVGSIVDLGRVAASQDGVGEWGLAAAWQHCETPDATLAAARAHPLDDFLAGWGAPASSDGNSDLEPVPSRWPLEVRADHASGVGWRPWAHLLLVPTPRPWEAPAWPTFCGAGEATPSNTALVLLAKHLFDLIGARVFGVAPATITFALPGPIADEATIDALHAFCRRICPDMFGAVGRAQLAAHVRAGRSLYFWWD